MTPTGSDGIGTWPCDCKAGYRRFFSTGLSAHGCGATKHGLIGCKRSQDLARLRKTALATPMAEPAYTASDTFAFNILSQHFGTMMQNQQLSEMDFFLAKCHFLRSALLKESRKRTCPVCHFSPDLVVPWCHGALATTAGAAVRSTLPGALWRWGAHRGRLAGERGALARPIQSLTKIPLGEWSSRSPPVRFHAFWWEGSLVLMRPWACDCRPFESAHGYSLDVCPCCFPV